MASAIRDMAEGKPLEGVVRTMTALSYFFLLLIVASAVAWIVFVAKGRQDKPVLNDANGQVSDAVVDNRETLGDNNQTQIKNTIDVCFQAVVATSLVYFVFRHHFSHLHY